MFGVGRLCANRYFQTSALNQVEVVSQARRADSERIGMFGPREEVSDCK
jgi:hypothetical protein